MTRQKFELYRECLPRDEAISIARQLRAKGHTVRVTKVWFRGEVAGWWNVYVKRS